jgi:hypothetical protein
MSKPYILCTDATAVTDEIIADNVERYDDIPTVFISPIDIESDISLNIYTAPPPPPPAPIVLQTPTTNTTQSKQCTCNLCVYLTVFYCSILLIIFVILLILFM